jgi:glyoxylase-like metal-dependent hydrolase (beta-lactamase superfamily II)
LAVQPPARVGYDLHVSDPFAPLLLMAGNPGPYTGRGNNTWLLDGDEPALIDAGTGAPRHVQALVEALGGRPLVRLLVTHGHEDHASGRPALVEQWPSLECWKWPAEGEGAWRALSDGQIVRAGDRALRVVFTPGHAADHVCFWDAGTRALYAGDMLILGSTVLIPGGRGGGLRAYLHSLDRLLDLDPAVIYPGHGNVIERPRELVTQYVRHRLARERQIQDLLDETGGDPDRLVARLYPALPEGLVKAARLTVEAHLEKLEDDQRAPGDIKE